MELYYQDGINARTNSVTAVGAGGAFAGYNAVLSVTFVEGSNAPTEPVTLEEAKLFCKIDVSEDDELLENDLIPGARQLCEAYTNLSFIERTIQATINNANGGFFLPYGPVQSTPTVAGSDDTELTAVWEFGQLNGPLGKSTVTYIGGDATLPKKLKLGLLNAIFYLYDNRSQATDDIGEIAKRILKPFRRV